jgi:hypothetical protein
MLVFSEYHFNDWFEKSGYDLQYRQILREAYEAGFDYAADIQAEIDAGEDW